jgi:hypothetical protein
MPKNFMKRIFVLIFSLSFAFSSFGAKRWIPKISAAAGGGNDLAFRAARFSTQASANGWTGTEPTGTAQNDIMIALALCSDSSTSLGAPSGWTVVTSGASAGNFKYNLAWIRRGASAPSLTWTMSGAFYREVYILSYSGATPSGTPYGATADGGVQINVSTPNGPAVTTTAANSLVLSIFVHWSGSGAGGWTKPTGYTQRSDNTSGNDGGAADKAVATSGTSEDPGAWTNQGGNNVAWTYTLELLD